MPFAIFFGGGFLLHLLWENLQAPFYQGYVSFSQHFWKCLKATATGDMLSMIIIYTVLALIHRDFFWVQERGVYANPATWLLPILLGSLFAIGIELWALEAHRWEYATMPTVFGIGLLPLLQMMFLPPLALLLTFFSLPLS